MAASGVGDLTDALQDEFGPFNSAADLLAARLTRLQIQRLECTEADHRRLWRFIVELQIQQQDQQSASKKGKKAVDSRAKAALSAATVRQAPKAFAKSAAATAPGVTGYPGPAATTASSAAVSFSAPRSKPLVLSPAIIGLKLLFDLDMPIGPFVQIACFLCCQPVAEIGA
mmetsp:Transcript_27024/g.87285  ORF Transcript_27024/g.87285 Transcript_27024/m.87285 type:complete len:171 (+) Transcript_27024:115-627(+)